MGVRLLNALGVGAMLIFGVLQAEEPVSIIPRAQPVSSTTTIGTLPGLFRVDSSLVLIPVHVTTPIGASVTNLSKENFSLFEDSQAQTITLFANDDAPISIGLVFDASGSMKNKRQKVAEAAAAFFKMANQQDEFFLVEFNDRVRLVVPFTADVDEIHSHIVRTRPYGRTALLDAVHLALREMKSARNLRKALVILSDGGDNWSRRTTRQVTMELLESDVQVYGMGIFDSQPEDARSREERDGPALLKELAGQTGGRCYTVQKLDDLPAISAKMSRELRAQYLLGYSPARPPRDGKYRRVQVKLLPPQEMPELRAYYRHGYYAAAP